MNEGIGAGRTREDHAAVARQVYGAHALGVRARSLEAIIGVEELSALERQYLQFSAAFEDQLLRQRRDEHRSIDTTLATAWRLLSTLPRAELSRIPAPLMAKYLGGTP